MHKHVLIWVMCIGLCSVTLKYDLYCDQSNQGEVETKHEQRTRRGGRRATLFVFGSYQISIISVL